MLFTEGGELLLDFAARSTRVLIAGFADGRRAIAVMGRDASADSPLQAAHGRPQLINSDGTAKLNSG